MVKSSNALIGATGLLGGVLADQRDFAATARSTTIGALEGQTFDTVFIAAARGSMFEANKFPGRDAQHIAALTESLAKIEAERAVLISTIAVLESFDGGFHEDTARFRNDLAYGRNRRRLEIDVAEIYPKTLIVRLPALFGAPIKKNFLFDLMNPVPSMLTVERREALLATLGASLGALANQLYSHSDSLGMWVLDRERLDANPHRAAMEDAVIDAGFEAARLVCGESTFQYYDLRRLSDDIDRALAAELAVIHLAPSPLRATSVHERLTGRPMPETGARAHCEDMRTIHAALFDREGPYLADAEATLTSLEKWVAEQGGAR